MHRNHSIIAVLGLMLAGCAATPGPTASDAGTSVQAGKTTFVRVPAGHGQFNVVAYPTPGVAVCSGCVDIAKDYFATGQLHKNLCDRCGSKVVVVHGQLVALQAGPPPLRAINSAELE